MTGARCELWDLPVEACACPTHRGEPKPARAEVAVVGQPFAARFPGQCVACEGRIAEGDRIVRAADNGGYVHADQRECAS